jgi:hypothetical protein
MEQFECSQPADGELPPCHENIITIHRYWLGIRPPSLLPGRQHLDPAAIPSLLPCIRLYDVFRDPWRFRYRLVGTELVRYMGRDPTGTWFGGDGSDASKSFRDLVLVASGNGLCYHRGFPVHSAQHKDRLKSERILLPLARNGRDIDMILSYTVHHPIRAARRVA